MINDIIKEKILKLNKMGFNILCLDYDSDNAKFYLIKNIVQPSSIVPYFEITNGRDITKLMLNSFEYPNEESFTIAYSNIPTESFKFSNYCKWFIYNSSI